MPEPAKPLYLIPLFPEVDRLLLDLLKSLSLEDWDRPTICKGWAVRDIAAHLLDTSLRRVSIDRDGFLAKPDTDIHDWQSLLDFLNRMNATWVEAMRRLSPQVLVDMLEYSLPHQYEGLAAKDPHAEALFSVAWAGEARSENWMDTAREYTEKWLHQMQIRHSLGKEEPLLAPNLFIPLLDTFMRALPHTYRNTTVPDGAYVRIHVQQPADAYWHLMRYEGNWVLLEGPAMGEPDCTLSLPPDTAWQLFSKGINKDQALQNIEIQGNAQLADPVLNMVSVMA